ncbi:MAG: transglycosylase SLT domain-containing protein [Bifidobacterium sp.]
MLGVLWPSWARSWLQRQRVHRRRERACQYEADVIRAGSICQVVTPSIIAAQIEQESNWNPKAGSGAGAQGIAQFMPGNGPPTDWMATATASRHLEPARRDLSQGNTCATSPRRSRRPRNPEDWPATRSS